MKTIIAFLMFSLALIAGLGLKRTPEPEELDFSVFDGDDDMDEVAQYLIDEGFVPRKPTEYEKLFLPHDTGTVVTLVFERGDMNLHLVEEERDEEPT